MSEKSNFIKFWENYWYHYKWHTIIGLFLVVTLAVGVTQCAMQPKYDHTAVLYCDQIVSDNTVAALEAELTKRATDENGDGQTLFEVYNVSYDEDGTSPQNPAYANSQKLMSVMSTADYVLYLVDEYSYQRLQEQNLFATHDFLPDKEGTAWNWKGSKLQQSLKGKNLPENLYFCLRKVAGTAAEKDEGAGEKVAYATQIIQRLMEEGK